MKKHIKIIYETVPVSGGFMITSILGFLVVTVYTISGKIDVTWGVTLALIFLIMFIASIVSITPLFPKELNTKR